VLPDILTATIRTSLFAAQLAQVSHHKPGVDLRSRTLRWITCQQCGHSISTTGSDGADMASDGTPKLAGGRDAHRGEAQVMQIALATN
jgi:5-methylcytosine-specific restriction endonuclease McrA